MEPINGTKDKVKCIDADGFMYLASYDMIRDKRTNRLDKFKKQNPFKAYNMRRYASLVQENVKILSTDEELVMASKRKVKFICPKCEKEYEKDWSHWIMQKDNCHFCPICSKKESSYESLVDKWLKENGFAFTREYWFQDCKDKRVLPFDFIVWNDDNIVLIEVDGCQHYYESPMFTSFTLDERKRKDKIKTDYCLEHGYILLRLPFWDFSKDTYIKKLKQTFFGKCDELP